MNTIINRIVTTLFIAFRFIFGYKDNRNPANYTIFVVNQTKNAVCGHIFNKKFSFRK